MESEVEVDASFNFRIGTYLVFEQSQEELDDMCQEIDPISGINIDSVKLSTFQWDIKCKIYKYQASIKLFS